MKTPEEFENTSYWPSSLVCAWTASEVGPNPTSFSATTCKLYRLLGSRPGTTHTLCREGTRKESGFSGGGSDLPANTRHHHSLLQSRSKISSLTYFRNSGMNPDAPSERKMSQSNLGKFDFHWICFPSPRNLLKWHFDHFWTFSYNYLNVTFSCHLCARLWLRWNLEWSAPKWGRFV